MLKYRGQYRVVSEIDKAGKVCEFSCIPCLIKKGANICRHNETTMNLYIPSARIGKRLLEEYPHLFRMFLLGDDEAVLLFQESDINEVAGIVKAKTKGANVSPRAKRNITFVQKYVGNERKTG